MKYQLKSSSVTAASTSFQAGLIILIYPRFISYAVPMNLIKEVVFTPKHVQNSFINFSLFSWRNLANDPFAFSSFLFWCVVNFVRSHTICDSSYYGAMLRENFLLEIRHFRLAVNIMAGTMDTVGKSSVHGHMHRLIHQVGTEGSDLILCNHWLHSAYCWLASVGGWYCSTYHFLYSILLRSFRSENYCEHLISQSAFFITSLPAFVVAWSLWWCLVLCWL